MCYLHVCNEERKLKEGNNQDELVNFTCPVCFVCCMSEVSEVCECETGFYKVTNDVGLCMS